MFIIPARPWKSPVFSFHRSTLCLTILARESATIFLLSLQPLGRLSHHDHTGTTVNLTENVFRTVISEVRTEPKPISKLLHDQHIGLAIPQGLHQLVPPLHLSRTVRNASMFLEDRGCRQYYNPIWSVGKRCSNCSMWVHTNEQFDIFQRLLHLPHLRNRVQRMPPHEDHLDRIWLFHARIKHAFVPSRDRESIHVHQRLTVVLRKLSLHLVECYWCMLIPDANPMLPRAFCESVVCWKPV